MPNKFTKNILSCFILGIMTIFFFVPLLSFAEGPTPPPTGGPTPSPAPIPIHIEIKNPFKESTIESLINTILNEILIPIGGVIAVMMIMYAGFMYVTAGGDPGKIKTAHDALKYAVIGAAILLGAWVISEAIEKTITQLRTP